jgi:hypothetical protein
MFARLMQTLRRSASEQARAGIAPKIFISYRRDDSSATAGRMADRLAARFGEGSIFIDVDAIPPGTDFAQHLADEIRQCDVMFAVIGSRWLGTDAKGKRRIDKEADFIRIELEAAFSIGKPVIPILLDETPLPRADELPPTLRELAFRNAVRVRGGMEFHRDMDRLIDAVQALLAKSGSESESATRAAIPDIDVTHLEVKRVFVSHATADRDWVEREIISFLNGKNVETWYSKNSISSSSQWEREILRGMESCDWFTLVVSPASSESEWVKDELNWAFHHRPTRIIPLIMQHCNLWDFHIRLPRLQYVDFTGNKLSAQQMLLKSFSDIRPMPAGRPAVA